LRYPPLSSLLNFDENDDRNNNNDRNIDRVTTAVFIIVIRVESFRCPTTTANEEKRRFV